MMMTLKMVAGPDTIAPDTAKRKGLVYRNPAKPLRQNDKNAL
ncbi:hypothetical protein [Thalassospira xiamenensis]|nr:hypothetical protein [Thalassospira xiamenensis]